MRTLLYGYGKARPLVFHEPDDDDDEPKKKGEDPQEAILTQLNKVVAGQNKQLLRGVTGQFETLRGEIEDRFVTKDDLNSLLDKIGGRQSDNGDRGDQNSKESGKDSPKPNRNSDPELPPGMKKQLELLNTRLNTFESENKKLSEQLQSERENAKRRDHESKVLSYLDTKNVRKKDQVLALIRPGLQEAKKDGKEFLGHEVDTEYGPDVVPFEQYVDGFLEENKHFIQTTKVGPGGSSGGEAEQPQGISTKDLTPDQYADPEVRKRVHDSYDRSVRAGSGRH